MTNMSVGGSIDPRMARFTRSPAALGDLKRAVVEAEAQILVPFDPAYDPGIAGQPSAVKDMPILSGCPRFQR